MKEYTNWDLAQMRTARNKETIKNKEGVIIDEMKANIEKTKDAPYYLSGKEEKKMKRAIANTIPLTAWIQ